MTTEETQAKTAQFNKEFSELLTKAFNEGVPLQNIIIALADAEFELRTAVSDAKERKREKKAGPVILTVSDMPPGLNGVRH